MCVGNGNNDKAMFEKAIDDGMITAIMGDASPDLIAEMREYASKSKNGRVIVIPKDKDLANKYILRFAKTFQSHMKVQERCGVKKKKQRLPDVPRINVKPLQIESSHTRNVNNRRTKNKGKYL